MKSKIIITTMVLASLISVGSKAIYVHAHGGNNSANVQSYNYRVDAYDGINSSGWVGKKHNTHAINNPTGVGGNKAVYSKVRYNSGKDGAKVVTEERKVVAGTRQMLKYKNPASWYYGHQMDQRFTTGSTVFVDVQIQGSWAPDDKSSNCTM